MMAYDRPSPKLLAFLSKYYNLQNYISQNNNFVIYNLYFDNNYDLQRVQSKNESENKNKSIFDSNTVEMKMNRTHNQGYKNSYQYEVNDQENSEYEKVKNHMIKKTKV